MGRQLTLLFGHFEQEHFGKDVFLVPYYLGKALGCDVTIAYPLTQTNACFPKSYRGVNLCPLDPKSKASRLIAKKFSEYVALFYPFLIKNARKIDILMLFHASGWTYGIARLFKVLNPSGKIYLKLDGSYKDMEWLRPTDSFIGNLQYKTAIKLKDYIDCVSAETKDDLEYLTNIGLEHMKFGDKLVFAPNGFDEMLLAELNVTQRTFNAKENLIVTVGRLGTHQKNTEMLLDALDGIDLNGWRVMLVGPVEDSFRLLIDRFFDRNPQKRQEIIFTGPVYDKTQLFDIYSRAKVFVLTSRWESSGLVLNEAYRLRDYIISTPVGAARDIICDGKYGTFVGLENVDALRSAIQEIVNGSRVIDVYHDFDPEAISYQQLLRPVIEKLNEFD